jgi:hypothetical protein
MERREDWLRDEQQREQESHGRWVQDSISMLITP